MTESTASSFMHALYLLTKVCTRDGMPLLNSGFKFQLHCKLHNLILNPSMREWQESKISDDGVL